MLKQRIITALILLPIALCGFFLLEGSGFALFIGLVVSLGAWEWARLAGFTAQSFRVGFAAVVALMLFVMYVLPGLAPWVLGASVLWWGVATWLVMTYPRTSELWASAACRLLIGTLILLPAWQGLVLLKHWPLGNWLILSVMVLVWAADIGDVRFQLGVPVRDVETFFPNREDAALRVFASPRQLFNAPGVAQVWRLDQGTESHAQGFGNQVQCGQADILLARLDRDQHAPADP